MFEVGKKVICIKSHSQGVVKKGQVFELLGIKKGCCKAAKILLDIGFRNNLVWECSICGENTHTDIWWLIATLFVPYDDTLSSITVEELLEEVEGTAEVFIIKNGEMAKLVDAAD